MNKWLISIIGIHSLRSLQITSNKSILMAFYPKFNINNDVYE